MTYHSSDPNRRDRTLGRPRDNTMGWVLGALAVLAVVGALVWMLNRDGTNTASTGADTNTGAATRSAPAPATPSPGTPSRP